MKQHFAEVKENIGSCKSVPPNVRFWMENSLQEFVNSKKAAQEVYECRNPYGPNVSQFEGDMTEGEEEVQKMQSPMAANSGKRKNQQWISILHQEILKELNLPWEGYWLGKKLFGK